MRAVRWCLIGGIVATTLGASWWLTWYDWGSGVLVLLLFVVLAIMESTSVRRMGRRY